MLGSIFNVFLIWSYSARTTEMLLYKAFRWVQHIQTLTFSCTFSIKNWYFFWCLILGLIFRYFDASSYQNARFWLPLGAPLGSKWEPKSPKWRQKAAIFIFMVTPFSGLISEIAFGELLGSVFIDFGWIWVEFSWIVDGFGMNFHEFRYYCSVVFLVWNDRHSIISQIYLDILLLAGFTHFPRIDIF